MTRLAATIRTDFTLQLRNGFYLATALVVVGSIVLLRWLPTETAALILPVVIIENVLMNTFYFVSGLQLLERVEGTYAAQSVTPLRDGEYLSAKLATLVALSLAESLLIIVVTFGAGPWLATTAIGVALAGTLFCLGGVAITGRYDSINEFLMPSVLYTFLLTLPVFGVFGVGAPAWYLPHPLEGPLSLMALEPPRSAAWLAYAIGYPLVWIAVAWVAGRRALARARGR
jgi:fluoroquinolone transport system permease protein